MVMNRETFLEKLKANARADIEIIKRKNSDYADDKDPFLNFKLPEFSGLTTTEKGIAVRIMDKIQRINNLLDKDEAAVKDETIADTLSDLRNYANILQVYLEDE